MCIRDSNGNEGNPLDSQVRRIIGISPQSLSLYDELTARENLEFFGQIYGLAGSKLKQRIDWSLEFSGLGDRQNDRITAYSGGMKRRLNIAVALIHEPQILLLDEPTVGVDPQSRNHIFDSIKSLKESGMTVIYTTHYMEEAQRLCDRVAIVDQGKLLALDTVDKLIDQFGGLSSVSAELPNSKVQQIDVGDLVQDLQINQHDIRFTSAQPLEAITNLTINQGLKFKTVKISSPDLESVFLNLTGRTLRD